MKIAREAGSVEDFLAGGPTCPGDPVFGMPSAERCMIEFRHLGWKMELENVSVYYDNDYRYRTVFFIR